MKARSLAPLVVGVLNPCYYAVFLTEGQVNHIMIYVYGTAFNKIPEGCY